MIPARRRKRKGPVPIHPFDAAHGTETGALIPGEELATGHRHDRHITAYHGTAPSLFRKLMRIWQERARWPIERTAFVDIGAGKGRAILLAAEMPFRRIVGVELHPGLAAAARENVELFHAQRQGKVQPGASRRSRSGSSASSRRNLSAHESLPPMRVEEADVMRLRMPSGPCCLFLFNPFDLVLMDRFLDRVTREFRGREEDVDLLYVNDEQRDLIVQEHPRFQEVWRGRIYLSHEDRDADKRIIEHCADGQYVTSGYEDCSMWRLRET